MASTLVAFFRPVESPGPLIRKLPPRREPLRKRSINLYSLATMDFLRVCVMTVDWLPFSESDTWQRLRAFTRAQMYSC